MANEDPNYSGPGYIEYNGRILSESKKIEFKVEANNKSVHTLVKGRAGHTPGPVEVAITVSNAVPHERAGGLEIDYVALCVSQREVPLVFVLAGKRYAVRGDIRDATLTTDAEGEANGANFSMNATYNGAT